jgi:hypothetical protein
MGGGGEPWTKLIIKQPRNETFVERYVYFISEGGTNEK